MRRSAASRAGNLLTILGPQQPLTTFGAEAGVLRLTLARRHRRHRHRPQHRQDRRAIGLHSSRSTRRSRDWRRDASLEITLLICTGLLLALLAGGLWYLAPATTARDDPTASPRS